ncbi:uncharacterized protein LOC126909754 [Daktulosphaira vitifoliae]|uniref:uncharacterized protein LOC126909754 n=1 Tax=Daktulosphaira vitifoliae TaxID=58002 RepID=UPI0021AA9DF2|nr:uncharacterized protein LOC126909754 [Daktulosphaira vitifoliae]
MNTSKINIYNIFGISLWFIMAIIINYTVITKSSDIEKNINETEVFYYEIQPELFNWTNGIDGNMFNYTPSLQNYPDLPYWIHYKFNEKNKFGYIYGTPPISSENQIKVITRI